MKQYLLSNPQVVVTVIIGFFTLVITWWFNRTNYKLNHQKMEKDLFSEFNKRYDKLNDDLSKLEPHFTKENLLQIKVDYNDEKSLYNAVIDYFNLCAEQHFWHKEERISKKIWKSWHRGMMYYHNNFQVVRELWEEEIKDEKYESYYLEKKEDFFKENYIKN